VLCSACAVAPIAIGPRVGWGQILYEVLIHRGVCAELLSVLWVSVPD